MQDVNVLVVFHSRFGFTERLALAAAVGAVNGRANIRLRLLPEAVTMPDWKEHRDRMDREYVAPRDADPAWADAILFGLPPETATLPGELDGWLRSLKGMDGKLAGCFTSGSWTGSLHTALERVGITAIPLEPAPDAIETARRQGRRIAEAARARR